MSKPFTCRIGIHLWTSYKVFFENKLPEVKCNLKVSECKLCGKKKQKDVTDGI